jgi:hypothetical protein
MKLFMYNPNSKNYCGAEVVLRKLTPSAQKKDGWFQYTVPLSAFKCSNLNQMTKFSFQNTAERNAPVCIAEVRLQ